MNVQRRRQERRRAFSFWTRIWVLILLSLGGMASGSSAKTRVVASIPDLGSIASAVGGEDVEVAYIARANVDVHRVEVLPSYMVRVSKAQLYLKVGLGLDQWADQIIDGSHNAKLKIVDCSTNINTLEKPSGRVDASMGDIHPFGNPHYWLDPRNGGVIAHTIAQALGELNPPGREAYMKRADDFDKQCQEAASHARDEIAEAQIKEVVTYHRSWTYLADAMGLKVAGEIEPLPGIPPTGKHLQELVTIIEQHKVPLVIVEPYFSDDAGNFLKRETGVRVAKLSPSCKDVSAGSYLAHFEEIVNAMKEPKA
ncbi:MAG TPA: metal ABC transporter substrate-binding protein [Dongiaceae bacterium]|jgi:zinc/manganese transport system substrate-binding protein|nr:metal ABC transporter substrate-binding protein [Dongiaceae bacterium]